MNDLEQINKFRQEFQGKFFSPWSEKDFKRVKNQKHIKFIYQRVKGKLIGLVVASITQSLTRKALEVEDYIIDEKYRGRGYGKLLYKKAFQLAKKCGVDCVEMTTKRTNKVTKAICDSFGMKDRKQNSFRIWLK